MSIGIWVWCGLLAAAITILRPMNERRSNAYAEIKKLVSFDPAFAIIAGCVLFGPGALAMTCFGAVKQLFERKAP